MHNVIYIELQTRLSAHVESHPLFSSVLQGKNVAFAKQPWNTGSQPGCSPGLAPEPWDGARPTSCRLPGRGFARSGPNTTLSSQRCSQVEDVQSLTRDVQLRCGDSEGTHSCGILRSNVSCEGWILHARRGQIASQPSTSAGNYFSVRGQRGGQAHAHSQWQWCCTFFLQNSMVLDESLPVWSWWKPSSIPICIKTGLRLLGAAVSGEMCSWHADLGLPKTTSSQNSVLPMARPWSLLVHIEQDLVVLCVPRAIRRYRKVTSALMAGMTLTLQKAGSAGQAPRSPGKCGVSRWRLGSGHSTSRALLFTHNNCMEPPPPVLPSGH